jgi:chromosome segregation ATPase
MASQFDESDFVDSDYEASRKSTTAYVPTAFAATTQTPMQSFQRPPSREELESKVSDAHARLAELKRVQDELERERAQLEEARRRRVEYQNGREEMLHHLTRGTEILKEAEFNTRRDAEQMAKTLADMREALGKVEGLHEESWTQENWNIELTRALTTLENARMEWNSARVKWPVLDGALKPTAEEEAKSNGLAGIQGKSFWQLCKLGFALSWPIALATLIGTGIIAIILFQH